MSKLEETTDIAKAVKLLKIYGCSPENRDNSPTARQQLREAILLVAQESEWENIGICAENLTRGLDALSSYLKALGYQDNFAKNSSTQGYANKPIYIKFNTRTMKYYVDSYSGDSRGVLIAMQGDDETILGTYGYFPLGLFTSDPAPPAGAKERASVDLR